MNPYPENMVLRSLIESSTAPILVHACGVILYANKELYRLANLPHDYPLIDTDLADLFETIVGKSDYITPITPYVNLDETLVSGTKLLLKRLNTNNILVEVWENAITFHDKQATILLFKVASTENEPYLPSANQMAYFDPLTQLPNRALFMDRLTHELVSAQRKEKRVALMFIDLDHFKRVNDTLGHAAGDQLLIEASQRIQKRVRKSDTVARLGGDEFTVILPDIERGPNSKRVASNILDSLIKPFYLQGHEAYISGSIGITIYPDDAENVADLIRNADSAMYKAKGNGRNAYCFYTPAMQTEALQRMELEKRLRAAVKNRNFSLYYQPILDLKRGTLLGAEAFLRWNEPNGVVTVGGDFISIAEEIGLIRELDEWTLTTACRQAREWCEYRHGDFLVSVNLSCKRCRDLSVIGKLEKILRQTGLPPDALVLEITENILMEDAEKALTLLHAIKKMGVSLWLDDFGTGYSSLSILKKLPVDGIKIDRIFVQDAPHNPDSAVLVNAMLNVAHNLALKVIGEGVETVEQQLFLQNRGCELAQGYLFGKPVPPEDFVKWLG